MFYDAVSRCLLAGCLAAGLQADLAPKASAAPVLLDWSDLRPPGAGGLPGMPDPHARVLAWEDPVRVVALAGYLLPVDRDGEVVREFLLVPWIGACSHAPPPPPNQAVLVIPAVPYRAKRSYEPVTISGRLKSGLEKTQLFIMDGVAVIESGYSMGGATVTPAETVSRDARPSPWDFLDEF